MKKKIVALLPVTLICCFTLFSGQIASKNDTVPTAHPNGSFRTKRTTDSVYQPSQIEHAYGINKLTSQGQKQTIAIVDAYGSPSIQSDLNTFDTKFNIPSTTINITYPEGKPATVNPRNTSLVQDVAGWGEETSLDVEWAHALAPKATIELVVAKSDSVADLFTAIDSASKSGAQVVSMSWGISEFNGETAYDSHFQNPNIAYIASSGDSGAGVEYPSSSPYVLAVGGTTLNLTSQSTIKSETAWSGSGGGISKYETEPSYQKAVNSISSSNKRAVPDVAFCVDPNTGVEIYDNGTWYVAGGTSFSAPSWGSIIAIADASRTTPLSNVQSKLYSIGNSTKYSSDFNDITTGRDGYASTDAAKKGYDFVTGWGTPIANNLVNDLINK